MANQLIQIFEMLIKRVNETPSHREFVRRWVGPYQGKVLQIETDTGIFHILLHRKGVMALQKGSYSSPDVIYKATSETLMNLFMGRESFRDLMNRWELIIIGAGHESVPLGQLMMRVLQSR